MMRNMIKFVFNFNEHVNHHAENNLKQNVDIAPLYDYFKFKRTFFK